MNEDLGFTQIHKPARHEKGGDCDLCYAHWIASVIWLGRYEDQFVLRYFERYHDGGHQ